MLSLFFAALIFPIPIIHFWLHALLPWWRKRPLLFYLWAFILWAGSFILFFYLEGVASVLFASKFLNFTGIIFIIFGALLVFSSILTLGLKNFFLWNVLRAQNVLKARVRKGPFRFFPHPAYLGYLSIMLGNFLFSGKIYIAFAFIFLLVLMPIVIVFEEEELKKRTE